jgi:uncharacterized protein YdeI (YjbR/CyaY-like superfamily)
MKSSDPKVDAYIAKSATFARPVLAYIRQMVHEACPDVAETLKWQFPHFMYHGILCSMAAFKQHCAFGFWHQGMREALAGDKKSADAMGQMGRITSVDELPKPAALKRLIKQAMKLNESGVKAPKPAKAKKATPLKTPPDLAAALKKSKKARETFEAFSPSHRKEYIEWISEAKREQTRQRRLKTTLEWLAEGKARNWKYERK